MAEQPSAAESPLEHGTGPKYRPSRAVQDALEVREIVPPGAKKPSEVRGAIN